MPGGFRLRQRGQGSLGTGGTPGLLIPAPLGGDQGTGVSAGSPTGRVEGRAGAGGPAVWWPGPGVPPPTGRLPTGPGSVSPSKWEGLPRAGAGAGPVSAGPVSVACPGPWWSRATTANVPPQPTQMATPGSLKAEQSSQTAPSPASRDATHTSTFKGTVPTTPGPKRRPGDQGSCQGLRASYHGDAARCESPFRFQTLSSMVGVGIRTAPTHTCSGSTTS